MATGTSTSPVGPVVRLQELTCQACNFTFQRPAVRGRLPRFCPDCQPVQRTTGAVRAGGGIRNKIDTNSGPYRWAHAVTMQRLAIELARTGLRTAMLGTYDGPKLEQAVKQALADLDAVVDTTGSHTVGARRAA